LLASCSRLCRRCYRCGVLTFSLRGETCPFRHSIDPPHLRHHRPASHDDCSRATIYTDCGRTSALVFPLRYECRPPSSQPTRLLFPRWQSCSHNKTVIETLRSITLTLPKALQVFRPKHPLDIDIELVVANRRRCELHVRCISMPMSTVCTTYNFPIATLFAHMNVSFVCGTASGMLSAAGI
jgi:hypothetical protein